MKKIMFNDRFGLTTAVLEGRKTQTRRIIPVDVVNGIDARCLLDFEKNPLKEDEKDYVCYQTGDGNFIDVRFLAKYKVGDEVAIAQKYSDIENMPFDREFDIERGGKIRAGWDNKMFVEAIYMPHHIRITNVRVERLQDISEEDCIAEGIEYYGVYEGYKIPCVKELGWRTAQFAYSVLIDNVCKKGTWGSNPYVFVYDFELVD